MAFAKRIASAISTVLLITRVGPKVSSVTAVEFSGTSIMITGSTNGALTESTPPTTNFAPFEAASSIWLWITFNCEGIVAGP